jgi:S-adenosylmethionine-diacylglycerol 3-amino-3-carboxypropyl transferase
MKDRDTIEQRARFDIIRYANCWEDADVLLPALAVREGGAYLSIASAGDNTLSLLHAKPSMVLAVDISATQLACLELRKAAFQSLAYEEVLQFIGVNPSTTRDRTYRLVRGRLSPLSRQFWDANPGIIAKGMIHCGKFERYFRLFRKMVLPMIHGRKVVCDLMQNKSEAQRHAFYRETWNNRRWRALFRIFFSRKIMGYLGRDPEFFTYVEGDVASRLLERAEYALTALATDQNPYLEFILTGNFGKTLPFYLREENFEKIRDHLDRLILFHGNLLEALRAHASLRFDGFNLSDIFEYMNYAEYVSELQKVIDASKPGTRVVYWNMLADRKNPLALKNRLATLEDLAADLFKQDKAFFYKALVIERVL